MYEIDYNSLVPYWHAECASHAEDASHDRVHLHYMDTDSFVLSFDTD